MVFGLTLVEDSYDPRLAHNLFNHLKAIKKVIKHTDEILGGGQEKVRTQLTPNLIMILIYAGWSLKVE